MVVWCGASRRAELEPRRGGIQRERRERPGGILVCASPPPHWNSLNNYATSHATGLAPDVWPTSTRVRGLPRRSTSKVAQYRDAQLGGAPPISNQGSGNAAQVTVPGRNGNGGSKSLYCTLLAHPLTFPVRGQANAARVACPSGHLGVKQTSQAPPTHSPASRQHPATY